MIRRAIIVSGIGLLSLAMIAASTEPAATNPIVSAESVAFFKSLDEGYMEAQKNGKPILVFVGDPENSVSTRAWENLQSALAAGANQTFVLVRLDLLTSSAAARSLGITATPEICLLRPSGRVILREDKALLDGTLSKWLDANSSLPADAVSTTNSARESALANLASPDPAGRQSALNALAADHAAAADVVALLFSGTMTARLTSLDLLERWGAPIDGIDPWNRDSFTPPRRSALDVWAGRFARISTTNPATSPTTNPLGNPAANLSGFDVQLDALLRAANEIDARAIREQMVQFGPDVLPQIRQHLDGVSNDTARQRLNALRYRLVANDRLAGEWPGGFDRLASLDPFVRRAAVDELAQHAKSEDTGLLLELFKDEDPFVRERGLRALREIGGEQTDRALVQLLTDPNADVRAAVLKTLAENPDPAITPDLIKYVAVETDADLVVHCIRVLQGTSGDDALRCLKDLLSHSQWRVRAEACDAIRLRLGESNILTKSDPSLSSAVVVALEKCLNDSDEFVITQAAIALVSLHLPAANEAVLKATDVHPNLAVTLMTGINRDPSLGVMLLPAIRKMISSARPEIRAAAITAICKVAPRTAGAEITAGLADADATVRQVAATGLTTVIQSIYPRDGAVFNDPSDNENLRHSADPAKWFAAFAAGQDRPPWMMGLSSRLEQLLTDGDDQTRVSAAIGLCALGKIDPAWPVLQKSADSALTRTLAPIALPLLDWDRRKALFDLLSAVTPDGQMGKLIESFALCPDSRALPQLWASLTDAHRDKFLSDINSALLSIYGVGDQRVRQFNSLSSDQSVDVSRFKDVLNDTQTMLKTGQGLQKTESLCLLYDLSPKMAGNAARPIAMNLSGDDVQRNDAMQILLLSISKQDAEDAAVQALGDPALRGISLTFLAQGVDAIISIRGTVYLSPSYYDESYTSGQIIPVHVPKGISPEVLAPLLADTDADHAAYAGYLLALAGDPRGLPPLLLAARTHGLGGEWGTLLYRAITKLNDDSKTPILEEIYHTIKSNGSWSVSQFYWTIRAMNGPNVLKLRKTIRDEIGTQQLGLG